MGVDDLLEVTGRLDISRMFEESVKISARGMSDDRGLISIDKRALYPGPVGTLTDICNALGIDEVAGLTQHLKAAQSVHFGSDGGISKCYLEFAPDRAPDAGLVFLALKAKSGVARQSRYKTMPQQGAETWLSDHIGIENSLYAAAMSALTLSQSHDPDGLAVVLHVTEDGTTRESIDISVADAGVSLADSANLLSGVFAQFGLTAAAFLTRHGHRQFGHLAVGHDQSGETFATIYFGARPL